MRTLRPLALVPLLVLCSVSSSVNAFAQSEPDCLLISLGHVGGMPEESIELPVLVVDPADLSRSQLGVAGMDLMVSWDPAVATLTGVELSLPAVDFLMAWESAAPGVVDISLATLNPLLAVPGGTVILNLKFDLAPSIGSTDVVVLDSELFDLDQAPICHVAADGRIDVGSVASQVLSWGRVKTRFD